MTGMHRNREQALETALITFRFNNQILQGIQGAQARSTLVKQIVDSLRRTEFVRMISNSKVSQLRSQPGSSLFDPLKAAIYYRNQGEFDEAHWIAFLGTHCGKHERYGWRLTAALYGGFQGQPYWTWQRAAQHPDNFSAWLTANQGTLLDPLENFQFSNHRKYESLNSNSRNHTGQVLASYIRWVTSHGDHRTMINNIQKEVGQNPIEVFDGLYKGITKEVVRFGRLGAFDHVCMLGKLSLAPVDPGKTYIASATGPREGAKLLLHNNRNATTSAKELEIFLQALGQHAGIGMQEVEDALCNWQKSPEHYIHFRG